MREEYREKTTLLKRLHALYPLRLLLKGLVTNYGEGGIQNGRGYVKFYAYRKGGGGKSFSHAEGAGGYNTFWGSFYAVA